MSYTPKVLANAVAILAAVLIVAAGCSTEATVQSSSDTTAGNVSEPSDTTAGNVSESSESVAEPTEVPPTAVPPTAEPAPEPTSPPPTAAPTDEPVDDEPVDDEPVDDEPAGDADRALAAMGGRFGDDLTTAEVSCILKGLADDDVLIAAMAADADFDELPIESQAAATGVAIDCAPATIAAELSQGFSEGASGTNLPPSVESCMTAAFISDRPDRQEIIIGFLALGSDQSPPESSVDPTVDVLVECVPGSAFVEMMADEALDDPSMAAALDLDCLSTNMEGDTLRPLWEGLIQDPTGDFDSLDLTILEPFLDAMFDCVSFGKLVASEAAAEGVELSDATIACIDVELADVDIAALIAGDDPAGEARIGAAVLSCLSPEELEDAGTG